MEDRRNIEVNIKSELATRPPQGRDPTGEGSAGNPPTAQSHNRQAKSWKQLAQLFSSDRQPDAAEEAASKAMDLFSDKGNQFGVCECSRILGNICHSRGETEKAINHFEAALGITSSFNWHDHLFWIHHSLAELFFGENKFGDAHAHIGSVKSHATNRPYDVGRAMELQARFWYQQRVLEGAKSEACALPRFTRRPGLRRMRSAAESSSGISTRRPLTNRISAVSSWKHPLVSAPVNSPLPAQGTRHHLASLFRRVRPRTTGPASGRISRT